VSTLDRAREAVTAELRDAFRERDRSRVEAAAVWLRSTGTSLVEVYEVLLETATADLPQYASTPEEHLRSFEVQESVRDLVARLAPRTPSGARGQVLLVVSGGKRWVLGVAALTHVLEDAGFSVVASPRIGLEDVADVVAGLDDPVAVCVGLHDLSSVPLARQVLRGLRSAHPQVRILVGGKADESVRDLAGLVGAHSVTRSMRETLAILGETANPLSPRELAVLGCVASGMSNPDAASHLGVAPATVKTHLDRVYAKLGTRDRTATVALAMRRGWIE